MCYREQNLRSDLQIVITPLFDKLPWSVDSEAIFWSLSKTGACLPHTVEASTVHLLLNVKQESCEY